LILVWKALNPCPLTRILAPLLVLMSHSTGLIDTIVVTCLVQSSLFCFLNLFYQVQVLIIFFAIQSLMIPFRSKGPSPDYPYQLPIL
jgi:hypothetical protein